MCFADILIIVYFNCFQRESPLLLLSDVTQDVEVRIAAYSAIMRCPTETHTNAIVELLNVEPVKQVGSFIFSHLTNIMHSNDPFKADVKAVLKSANLDAEFDLNSMTFSKNYETAYQTEGGSAEVRYDGDVIFSPDSFIPRSARANFTVNMFGESLNVFEIGARAEGFESNLERIFGTSSERDNQDIVKLPTDPRASLYIKLFNNELNFWDFANLGDNEPNFSEMLLALSQRQEYNARRSLAVLDSQLRIPTIIGLPLEVTVDGNAVVDVGVGGKLDLRQVLESRAGFDLEGFVKPRWVQDFLKFVRDGTSI